MKILNLYSGIGGNRKLWGEEHSITAVEMDEGIASVYGQLFPDDVVIICDAHDFLLKHYAEYDFIWSSPPCTTHSRARYGLGVHGKGYPYVYPDMRMYQEIILLKSLSRSMWCIENVLPYYDYLICPSVILGRHAYWSNFYIPHKVISPNGGIAGHTCKGTCELDFHKKRLGIDIDRFDGIDKRKALRNCVEPEIGLYILQCAAAHDEDYLMPEEIKKMVLFET